MMISDSGLLFGPPCTYIVYCMHMLFRITSVKNKCACRPSRVLLKFKSLFVDFIVCVMLYATDLGEYRFSVTNHAYYRLLCNECSIEIEKKRLYIIKHVYTQP